MRWKNEKENKKLLFIEKDSVFLDHIIATLSDMGIMIIPYRQGTNKPELIWRKNANENKNRF